MTSKNTQKKHPKIQNPKSFLRLHMCLDTFKVTKKIYNMNFFFYHMKRFDTKTKFDYFGGQNIR